MSHEITEQDAVILHKKAAWHGLGEVVEHAPTPLAAQQKVLNWRVEQTPVLWRPDPKLAPIESADRVVNYRPMPEPDGPIEFAVVSKDWTPVQNDELALFCQQLIDESDINNQIVCESVGSIQQGRKVWFLLKGQAFEPLPGDTMFEYMLVSNGHDGTTALRCTPTSTRVVCSNTLHAVIPSVSESGRVQAKQAAWVGQHRSGITEHIEDAKSAIADYYRVQRAMRDGIQAIADTKAKTEDVELFFFDAYELVFGKIPTSPQTVREHRERKKALKLSDAYRKRYASERYVARDTLWNCVNSFTGVIQHGMPSRIKDAEKAREAKLSSRLFGVDSERTGLAYSLAVSMAG